MSKVPLARVVPVVGCGIAMDARYLAENGVDYQAVDLSRQSLRLAGAPLRKNRADEVLGRHRGLSDVQIPENPLESRIRLTSLENRLAVTRSVKGLDPS